MPYEWVRVGRRTDGRDKYQGRKHSKWGGTNITQPQRPRNMESIFKSWVDLWNPLRCYYFIRWLLTYSLEFFKLWSTAWNYALMHLFFSMGDHPRLLGSFYAYPNITTLPTITIRIYKNNLYCTTSHPMAYIASGFP